MNAAIANWGNINNMNNPNNKINNGKTFFIIYPIFYSANESCN